MKEKKIIQALTVVIVLVICGLIFFIYENNESEKIRIKQKEELDNVYLDLDSISNSLNEKILTISQLGGDIDSLLIIKENLEIEKREFPTDNYSYDMGNDINDSLKEWKKEIKKILS